MFNLLSVGKALTSKPVRDFVAPKLKQVAENAYSQATDEQKNKVNSLMSGLGKTFAAGKKVVDPFAQTFEYGRKVATVRDAANSGFQEFGINYDMIQQASPEVRDQFMQMMGKIGAEVP